MPIATKLGLAFFAVLLMTAIVGVFSIFELARVNEISTRLSSRWLPSVRVIEDIKSQVARVRTREFQYIISTDPVEMDKYDKVIATDLEDLQKMQKDYEKLLETAEEKQLYSQFVEQWALYMAEDAKIRAAVRAGNSDLGKKLIRGESNKLIVSLRGQVDKLVNYYSEGGKDAALEGVRRYASSRVLIVSLMVGSVVLGAAAALIITRSLVRGLGGEPGYAADIVTRIAAGDLSEQVEVRAGDSHSLLYAMKTMRDSLARIVTDVRGSTHVIASASDQIAAGNLDLSSRTEQQASSLEETAASMEELTSTVRQNSDVASQANQLAGSASKVAQAGSEVVGRVVHTMESINASSRKIGDIISVIDGIAFQTNILALNAAVEAARAGEQGRGFAVVASEVRNLAQRSAGAAKEIKELIGNSVNQVEEGSKLVAEAGTTMDEVVSSVRRVTDMIAEITHAGKEQSNGIEQVNQAIAQMDTVTQQNAELVQQATTAAQSMQEQATALAQLVSVFRLSAQEERALHQLHVVPGTPTVAVGRGATSQRRLAVASR
ncbi:methyl-accepting chemotaxis protein [Duganella sp. FT80W]|uniref:Methyl-accepting chemotaxis protein n=1 Tax=Duganella guangzhouensis TaxID=2666084 RepID=A0A6I2L793_9BURK|nr:methyl-accepting chemotaxis protein [Duganella guangzhouensis]